MRRELMTFAVLVAITSASTVSVLQMSTVFAACDNNQCSKQHSVIQINQLECDDCWETVVEEWKEVCTVVNTAPGRHCSTYSAVVKRTEEYGCNGQDECELLNVTTVQGTRCNTNPC